MSPFRKALIGTASSIALLASLSIVAVAADPAADAKAGAALTSIALNPANVPAPSPATMRRRSS